MELIDKSAVVAEIKRRISLFNKEKKTEKWSAEASQMNVVSLGARIAMLEEILSFINTIEVKEVDLNKENKNLKMLLDVIDYSFLQTDGSYDKSLTYPVIDKVLFIKKNII